MQPPHDRHPASTCSWRSSSTGPMLPWLQPTARVTRPCPFDGRERGTSNVISLAGNQCAVLPVMRRIETKGPGSSLLLQGCPLVAGRAASSEGTGLRREGVLPAIWSLGIARSGLDPWRPVHAFPHGPTSFGLNISAPWGHGMGCGPSVTLLLTAWTLRPSQVHAAGLCVGMRETPLPVNTTRRGDKACGGLVSCSWQRRRSDRAPWMSPSSPRADAILINPSISSPVVHV